MKVITPLCAFVTVAVLMFLLHTVVAEVKPLSLTVRPQVSFAPTDLQIQIRVHTDDTDRWINVLMDSGEYRRTSGFTIEPGRTLYTVAWRGIPQGEYTVLAALGHGETTRSTASAHVVVNGF